MTLEVTLQKRKHAIMSLVCLGKTKMQENHCLSTRQRLPFVLFARVYGVTANSADFMLLTYDVTESGAY